MERTERFRKILIKLEGKRSVSKVEFLEDLEVSAATFKRDIAYLRDRMGTPIIWDRSMGGYRFEVLSEKNQLPGLWFNASEMHALLVMEFLLENLQPGLLVPHLEPLRLQIRALMEESDHTFEEVVKRIRLLPLGSREYDTELFGIISAALLSRKRLNVTHFNRERNESTQREVSPQRLAHYRDNWFLDTWCHMRNNFRSFSLEALTSAELVEKKAKEISEKKLNDHLASSYGIYSGKPDKIAKLKFSSMRARWVSGERWHPLQKTYFDDDGFYYMEIPYNDERELIMDILKYGNDVEVLKPKDLRALIADKLEISLSIYS